MIRKLAIAAIAALAPLLLGLSPAAAQASIDIVNGAGVHTKLGVNPCGTDTGVTVLCYKFILVDTSNSPFDPATKQLQQSMITALGSPLQAGGHVNVDSVPLASGAASAANQASEVSLLTTVASATNAKKIGATSTVLSIPATTSTATYGPWTPQLDRDAWISFAITGGTASINVVQTTDGVCADGYQMSLANSTYIAGAFASVAAGRYREKLGQESQSGAQWCVTVTPAGGASVVGSLAQ